MRLQNHRELRTNAAPGHGTTRFSLTMGLLVAALFLLDSIVARTVRLDGLSQLFSLWPGLLIVSICLWFCHWRPLPRFIDSCQNAIWAILLVNLLSTWIQICGRSPYPLVDARLAHIDRLCHIDTAGIVHAVAQHSALQLLFALAYCLAPLQIMAALLLPPFVGQVAASRRYLVSLVLATFLTATLFALCPAAGPWTTENLRPTDAQLQVTRYLALLKSSAHVRIDFDSAAIVSFPSFHVVLAILSAAALHGIRRVRIVSWVFACLACLSTLATGWHYGIDLVGGFAVAGLAQLGAVAISPYFESEKPMHERGEPRIAARNTFPDALPETSD